MTIVESIFLGLVQGLSEFLPISSSGHLKLAERIFCIQSTLLFDVTLHVATALSVVVGFLPQVKKLFVKPVKNRRLHRIIFATLCTLPIALVMRLFVLESPFEPYLLTIGFALTTILLWLTSLLPTSKSKPLWAKPTWVVLVCGAVQGIATLPGLSRSCTTISTLKLLKVDKNDAVEFSFLLSLPIILASALAELVATSNTTFTIPWYCFLTGFVVAFLSGLLGIRLVQKLFGQDKQHWFALYMTIPLLLSILLW